MRLNIFKSFVATPVIPYFLVGFLSVSLYSSFLHAESSKSKELWPEDQKSLIQKRSDDSDKSPLNEDASEQSYKNEGFETEPDPLNGTHFPPLENSESQRGQDSDLSTEDLQRAIQERSLQIQNLFSKIKTTSERFYLENKNALENQKETLDKAHRYLLVASNAVQDPKIQNSLSEIIRNKNFKALVLTELLVVILAFVYSSIRKPHSSFMNALMRKLAFTGVYIITAALFIPTLFLGLSYPRLLMALYDNIKSLL